MTLQEKVKNIFKIKGNQKPNIKYLLEDPKKYYFYCNFLLVLRTKTQLLMTPFFNKNKPNSPKAKVKLMESKRKKKKNTFANVTSPIINLDIL